MIGTTSQATLFLDDDHAPRGLALSPAGERIASWSDREILVTSRAGVREAMVREGAMHVAAFAHDLWRVSYGESGWQIDARGWDTKQIAAPAALPELGPTPGFRVIEIGAPVLMVSGASRCELRRNGSGWHVTPLSEIPIGAGGSIISERGGVFLQRHGRRTALELGTNLQLRGIDPLFGGTYIVLELAGPSDRRALVLNLRLAEVVRRIRIEGAATMSIVERRGHAVIVRDHTQISVLDLIGNQYVGERKLEASIAALAVSADASTAAMLSPDGAVTAMSYAELVERRALVSVPAPAETPAAITESPAPVEIVTEAPAATAEGPTPVAEATAADTSTPIEEPELLRTGTLRSLSPRRSISPLAPEDLDRYLADAFELVAALCGRAIARSWDTGRLGGGGEFPYSDEVAAILDGTGGRAPQRVASSEAREKAAWAGFRRWNREGAPHVELAVEIGLSALGSAMLLVIAAPTLWGELARAYGVLANDRARPLCDELLVGQLLGASPRVRRELARELEDDAPLIRHGLVIRGPGRRPFAELAASEAAIARLGGDDGASLGRTGMLEPRTADRELAALHMARPALLGLLEALALPPGPKPPRVVLRGRTGSGRRTLAAALAARAGRRLATLDPSAGPRESLVERMRDGLTAAHVRGWLPCVSGLDHVDDPALVAAVRAVIDAHPGPLFVRAALDAAPPLAPGFITCALDALPLAQRERAWREALAAHRLDESAAPALAARYDVGPGTMNRVAASTAALGGGGDVGTILRQQRASRITTIAQRVERLAHWDDMVVDDDVTHSVRDFCERIRHREHVLDRLGMGRVASTGRSLCALFQGAPGTGKTMIAGVIARELGYELYRVDLSKVVSKWIGETEKNLALVFEAAEDGDVILLFDEADSLFAKRTDVKTSNDRNANLEVNYLLQRLDTFTGIAILTTNFGTAIDPAFKRRLSARITIPLPDERLRERLWRAHLPATLDRRGDLGLATLSARYEMSGGYIRNAALRAAYVAAARRCPLDAELLEEAVRAEYRDADRLREGGPLS
jgi:hypothetical protein